MRAARIAFLVAAIGAGVALLWDDRAALLSALGRSDHLLLVLGMLCTLGNLAFAGWSWFALLRDQHISVSAQDGARIFALGQVGKYLPGGIWSFVASAELGHDAGFERRTIFASFILALIIGLVTGLLLGLATLPELILPRLASNGWLLLVMAPLLLLVHPAPRRILARVTKLEPSPRPATLLGSSALALAGWFFAGLQIYLFAAALDQPVEAFSLVLLTGIYAASWIIGFLFVIAPAGLGPREATMIALLTTMMPVQEAALIAILSRVAMTLADVFAAIVAAALKKPIVAQ